MQKDNPGARFGDITKSYYKAKRDEDAAEYNRRLQVLRVADGRSQREIPSRVKKLMESEPLKEFMMQTEIQEVAERQEQFEAMLKERQEKMASAHL